MGRGAGTMTLLSALAAAFGGRIVGGRDVTLADVHLDSRRLEPGSLFVALPGTGPAGRRDDGARYVAEAIERGAVAVLAPCGVTEGPLRERLPSATPLWLHPHPRRAAGLAAARVHGDPSERLQLAGITGTNGKTSSAHILGHLLILAGRRPAVLGTAGHSLAGGVKLSASHTTPDAPELQRILARHRLLGGDSCVMEVSSHALAQERTVALDFDVALFTNLSRDHLDYHGDMDAYAAAKARLFSGLSPGASAVLNRDDPAWGVMRRAAEAAGARVLTYSTRRAADLRASRLRTDGAGLRMTLDGMGISAKELRFPLRGRYNVENALAAAVAACRMGASPSTIVEGLATTSSAPGRMEPIPTGGRGFSMYVDYAHTPEALRNALSACAPQRRGGRLIVVFGCGGERDRGKRGAMGAVAAELSDLALVTSDNPRGEDPSVIIADILAGMQGAEGMAGEAKARVEVETDRRRAIDRAVSLAREGDVVLVAGKGHERHQVIGGRLLPFDDRCVAREALA